MSSSLILRGLSEVTSVLFKKSKKEMGSASEVQVCKRADEVQPTKLGFGNEEPGHPVPFSFAA